MRFATSLTNPRNLGPLLIVFACAFAFLALVCVFACVLCKPLLQGSELLLELGSAHLAWPWCHRHCRPMMGVEVCPRSLKKPLRSRLGLAREYLHNRTIELALPSLAPMGWWAARSQALLWLFRYGSRWVLAQKINGQSDVLSDCNPAQCSIQRMPRSLEPDDDDEDSDDDKNDHDDHKMRSPDSSKTASGTDVRFILLGFGFISDRSLIHSRSNLGSFLVQILFKF